MTETEARTEHLLARLRQGGHRVTPQRVALLRLLAAGDAHPSALELHRQLSAEFPTTSPATVYKTLHLLQSMGEVLELGFPDDDNRYDGHNPAPHPHLVCTRCRRIVDPPVDVLDRALPDLERQSGFQIDTYRLDFFGLCPACRGSS